jgi:hypothetical protein
MCYNRGYYFSVIPLLTLRNLFTKHAFNKIFPVPQFMFNHNSLSYYGYSMQIIGMGRR